MRVFISIVVTLAVYLAFIGLLVKHSKKFKKKELTYATAYGKMLAEENPRGFFTIKQTDNDADEKPAKS